MWLGIPLVVLVAASELANLPFMSHHGRKQFWRANMFLIGFPHDDSPCAFLFTRYAWDVVFFSTAGYASLRGQSCRPGAPAGA